MNKNHKIIISIITGLLATTLIFTGIFFALKPSSSSPGKEGNLPPDEIKKDEKEDDHEEEIIKQFNHFYFFSLSFLSKIATLEELETITKETNHFQEKIKHTNNSFNFFELDQLFLQLTQEIKKKEQEFQAEILAKQILLKQEISNELVELNNKKDNPQEFNYIQNKLDTLKIKIQQLTDQKDRNNFNDQITELEREIIRDEREKFKFNRIQIYNEINDIDNKIEIITTPEELKKIENDTEQLKKKIKRVKNLVLKKLIFQIEKKIKRKQKKNKRVEEVFNFPKVKNYYNSSEKLRKSICKTIKFELFRIDILPTNDFVEPLYFLNTSILHYQQEIKNSEKKIKQEIIEESKNILTFRINNIEELKKFILQFNLLKKKISQVEKLSEFDQLIFQIEQKIKDKKQEFNFKEQNTNFFYSCNDYVDYTELNLSTELEQKCKLELGQDIVSMFKDLIKKIRNSYDFDSSVNKNKEYKRNIYALFKKSVKKIGDPKYFYNLILPLIQEYSDVFQKALKVSINNDITSDPENYYYKITRTKINKKIKSVFNKEEIIINQEKLGNNVNYTLLKAQKNFFFFYRNSEIPIVFDYLDFAISFVKDQNQRNNFLNKLKEIKNNYDELIFIFYKNKKNVFLYIFALAILVMVLLIIEATTNFQGIKKMVSFLAKTNLGRTHVMLFLVYFFLPIIPTNNSYISVVRPEDKFLNPCIFVIILPLLVVLIPEALIASLFNLFFALFFIPLILFLALPDLIKEYFYIFFKNHEFSIYSFSYMGFLVYFILFLFDAFKIEYVASKLKQFLDYLNEPWFAFWLGGMTVTNNLTNVNRNENMKKKIITIIICVFSSIIITAGIFLYSI